MTKIDKKLLDNVYSKSQIWRVVKQIFIDTVQYDFKKASNKFKISKNIYLFEIHLETQKLHNSMQC